jgi:hypothetical protein
LVPLKKSLVYLFTPIFGPENEGGLAVFRGFSAESTFHILLWRLFSVFSAVSGEEARRIEPKETKEDAKVA